MTKLSSLKMVCVVFVFCAASIIASPAQTLTTLYSFCSQSNCSDGSAPNGWMVQATDGNFYGTTVDGGSTNRGCGSSGCGTVFKITAAGMLTTLHSFDDSDGANPSAGLVQGSDGNFYGVTADGPTNCSRGSGFSCGTIFKVTPDGTLTTLYTFCSQPNCTDGFYPVAGLVQGSDGNFYGTTWDGGHDLACMGFGCGTVFKVTPSGILTTLYTFCSQQNCADGAKPSATLVQGSDGNFYGTTSWGGGGYNCTDTYGCGTVFKISPGGALTTLHIFAFTDGYLPSGLIQATDGNFYGTTLEGGIGLGTVFKITAGGTLTSLHILDSTDGGKPSGLIQATDGSFYGTTAEGGNENCMYGCGTIFKISPSGALTTLYSFDAYDGLSVGLLQATDGNFYGATESGGANGDGTVFRLGVGLGAFVEVEPTSGEVGAPVTILGTNLTGATSVTFNGSAATFNVVSGGSEITTKVPAGATTGTVEVTTPGGTLTSNTDFQVIAPFQLVPVTPCRLVDTRQTHNPIQGGTSQSFIVPQLGDCGVPTRAAAYSLNVTVSPHGPLGYLTIWPNGEIQPYASTMNSPDGRTKANAAIVPSGNNAVSVYASDTTDVILDIDGYFVSSSSQTYEFYPLTPCRVIDTRHANGDLGGPFLTGGQERDFAVLESSCIPTGVDAAAYSFNFTVVPHPAGQPLSYLTVWPKGQPQPTVSTLNNPTATVVANAAIVPAGTGGGFAVFPSNNTDLIVDINGYFAAPGQNGLQLYPVAPCRVIDTRNNNGQPFVGELTVNVVDSVCGPPASAQAYVFNATVVPSGYLGYLTLWPDGQGQPVVSTLNAFDGLVTSNMAIVPTTNGSIDAYASNLTQLLLDISSYFAP